jgi:glutamate synthase domain-containing protein 2
MLATIIIVVLISALVVLYIHDRRQTTHTILRNFPIIGYFRYFAETLGEYMRQYQYLPDWSERPFNRLERSWVYRSAKGVSNLRSFGSENVPPFIFRNAAFPILEEEKQPWAGKQIGITEGPGACRQPYKAMSFFNISGMSYGALSHAAVSALSRGAKIAGIWMATGEGGLAPNHLEGGCDVIMQMGTAKYGVRDEHGNLSEEKLRAIADHQEVRMFEVKLAQGAKPGKGGILPGAKVTPTIAAIRGIPAWHDSISPNRHKDIGNVRELGAFVNRVRTVTGKPVGVKFVAGDPTFLDDWFTECTARPEGCPDYVQIDGGEVAAARERHGLTDRIRIIAAGKLITPDKVAWALCMGADFVSSARGFMFSLGCIQAMKCGSGKCPTGVTSSDERLISGLDPTDKAARVARYAQRIREDVETIAHSCGLNDPSGFMPKHVTDIERGVGGFRAPQGGD